VHAANQSVSSALQPLTLPALQPAVLSGVLDAEGSLCTSTVSSKRRRRRKRGHPPKHYRDAAPASPAFLDAKRERRHTRTPHDALTWVMLPDGTTHRLPGAAVSALMQSYAEYAPAMQYGVCDFASPPPPAPCGPAHLHRAPPPWAPPCPRGASNASTCLKTAPSMAESMGEAVPPLHFVSVCGTDRLFESTDGALQRSLGGAEQRAHSLLRESVGGTVPLTHSQLRKATEGSALTHSRLQEHSSSAGGSQQVSFEYFCVPEVCLKLG